MTLHITNQGLLRRLIAHWCHNKKLVCMCISERAEGVCVWFCKQSTPGSVCVFGQAIKPGQMRVR